LTKLKKLDLFNNPKIKSIPSNITATLEELIVAGRDCGISQEALVGLTKLKKLDAYRNLKITTPSFDHRD